MLKQRKIFVSVAVVLCLISMACAFASEKIIDERDKNSVVEKVLKIDKVWPGHPVGFFLMTNSPRQYIAYYNADRRMVVGMRKLEDDKFQLYQLPSKSDEPPKYRKNVSSTILGWDSHNYITMHLDSKGYLHLSGNMHCSALTYFRSEKPYDITTLKQVDTMVGPDEGSTTYPKFMTGPKGELIFHCRSGSSGNGNEIYNAYDSEKQTWSRLLDTPLTDGMGKMNAYILGPLLGPDNWYHISWVWRDTPDCATNHDFSYLKSKDLRNWQTASGKPVDLPVTINNKSVIVDSIPVNGGIINGSGQIGFDAQGRAVLVYHKFDENGKTQAYAARFENNAWALHQLTNWDYRWEFSGGGSISNKVKLSAVSVYNNKMLELDYSNAKHGKGTWLIDSEKMEIRGRVLRNPRVPKTINKPESKFPGIGVRIANDSGNSDDESFYVMRWETLGRNRDRPRKGELPQPSQLSLYKVKRK